jgi:hypothetical protein
MTRLEKKSKKSWTVRNQKELSAIYVITSQETFPNEKYYE